MAFCEDVLEAGVRACRPLGSGQALRLPRSLRRGAERRLRRRGLHRHGPAEDARPARPARSERVALESFRHQTLTGDSLVPLLAELGQGGGPEDLQRFVVYIATTMREPERWDRFAEAVRRQVPGGGELIEQDAGNARDLRRGEAAGGPSEGSSGRPSGRASGRPTGDDREVPAGRCRVVHDRSGHRNRRGHIRPAQAPTRRGRRRYPTATKANEEASPDLTLRLPLATGSGGGSVRASRRSPPPPPGAPRAAASGSAQRAQAWRIRRRVPPIARSRPPGSLPTECRARRAA